MAYEQKDMTGALFPKKDKKPKQPDYTGNVMINGVKYDLAGWVNTAKTSGMKFLSLRVEEGIQAPDTATSDSGGLPGLDDEIPF